MPILMLFLLTFQSAFAIRWSFVTSDGKNNLRQSLNEKVRNFKLDSYDCKIDEIVKRGEEEETRAVICEIGDDRKVTTIAACSLKDGKVNNTNVGDLSFIRGLKVHSVVLICDQ